MSFVWVGIGLAASLVVAGGTAYFLLQALFRAIASSNVQQVHIKE